MIESEQKSRRRLGVRFWHNGKEAPFLQGQRRSLLRLALLLIPVVGPGRGYATSRHIDPPGMGNSSPSFVIDKPPSDVSELAFRKIDGTRELLRRYRGKLILLNYWATWCPICSYELQSLNQLGEVFAKRPFAIIAVSMDKNGSKIVPRYLQKRPHAHLNIRLSIPIASGGSGRETTTGLQVYGVPMTYVIGADGFEYGYILGAEDWTSPESKRFVKYFLNLPPH